MEQPNNYEKEIIRKLKNKVNMGIALIILSPLLGSLLSRIYTIFVGSMIFTDTEADMFWFSCILATIITGVVMVLVGCHENKANIIPAQNKNQDDKS